MLGSVLDRDFGPWSDHPLLSKSGTDHFVPASVSPCIRFQTRRQGQIRVRPSGRCAARRIPMSTPGLSRRDLLIRGSAGLALLHAPWLVQALPSRPGEAILPWLDEPGVNPSGGVVENLQPWEDLVSSFITPSDKFFRVSHYDKPILDEKKWNLEIVGLVEKPMTLAMPALRALPKREVLYTIECGGNHGFPWFTSGIGNAKWGGAPLAPLLKQAGVLDRGIEVVFWGADSGTEAIRDMKLTQHFARSMSLADAMSPHNLLCYEMNGGALPQPHGAPVRLIAPGWYGIANVKWLTRIEVRDARYMGRFMARDYVTIREEERNGVAESVETSVGRTLLKSAPARVTRKDGRYRIVGAAWGRPIARVDVQISGGPWFPATIDRRDQSRFAWSFWSIDWPNAAAGEHTITSRAVDTQGQVQPAMDDPRIARKKTYWESNGHVSRRIRIA
ncbi:MAG: sulfite oxidase [Burkholderiaceae bacterium]